MLDLSVVLVGACPAIPLKVTGLVLTFPLSWLVCCFLQWPRMSLVLNVLFVLFCFSVFLFVSRVLLVFLSVSFKWKQLEKCLYTTRTSRLLPSNTS